MGMFVVMFLGNICGELWEFCGNAVGSDLNCKNDSGNLFNNTEAFLNKNWILCSLVISVIGRLWGLCGNVHCTISLLIQGLSVVDYQALAQKPLGVCI